MRSKVNLETLMLFSDASNMNSITRLLLALMARSALMLWLISTSRRILWQWDLKLMMERRCALPNISWRPMILRSQTLSNLSLSSRSTAKIATFLQSSVLSMVFPRLFVMILVAWEMSSKAVARIQRKSSKLYRTSLKIFSAKRH